MSMHRTEWEQLRLVNPTGVTCKLTVAMDGVKDHLTWGWCIMDEHGEEYIVMNVTHDRCTRQVLEKHLEALGQTLRRVQGNLSPF